MNEDNSSGDKRGAGLYHEEGPDQTISALPERQQEGEDGDQEVVEDDEGTVTEELEDLRRGHGDGVLVLGAVDRVHRDQVVQEVRHPEGQVVVQNVESVLHDVSGALFIYQPTNDAGANSEGTGCNFVAETRMVTTINNAPPELTRMQTLAQYPHLMSWMPCSAIL